MENKNFLSISLENIVNDDFGKYAKYIIQDRALPDIRDGLKPVQRRIIYAMNNLHLFYDQLHKKSARTVGEVIGKYHPHGDTSIYDAMVRMSQDWKNNIPLIDMHGNNGSIDGDGPAAMRYTECRLSLFGQTMVNNIDKNAVNFINNFDDSEKEPVVFPSLLPNLLINGASGIAAGYATSIPPFNLNEVIDAIITRIDSPNCYLKSILNVMPGPDFPTKGIIMNPQGITEAYEKGKGKITIRGKIEQYSKKQLIITSIPYDTNKASIIHQIDVLREKYDNLGLTEVRDETDKKGIAIALEINKPQNIELIKNIIYKETQLQVSFTMNMVAIIDHKPVQFSILQALDAFIKHIDHIVVASSKYDLQKAKSRKEIIEGLIKAISVIDDIVDIIRRANNKEDAKNKIMNFLSFTNNQAEAIVQLRLYRLTNTDVTQLKDELNTLNETINNLTLIIENKTLRNNYIKNQLREYKKIFGSERKTEISHEDDKIQINEVDKIENRDVVIAYTYDGYLKLFTMQTISSIELNTINVKTSDIPLGLFASNLRHKIVLITSKGNYITIPTFKIPVTKWKDIGTHINNIVAIGDNEKIIYAFNYENNLNDPRGLLLVSANGKVKRLSVQDLTISKIVKISSCINLDNNDEIVSCNIIGNLISDNYQVAFVTNTGYGYKCNLNEISILGRTAAGIKSINLNNNQKVIGGIINNSLNSKLLLVTKDGMKRISFDDIPQFKRPSTGRPLISLTKTNLFGLKYAILVNSTDQCAIVSNDGMLSFIKTSNVPIADLNTRVSKVCNFEIAKVGCYKYITNKNSIEETANTLLTNDEQIEHTSSKDDDQKTLIGLSDETNS